MPRDVVQVIQKGVAVVVLVGAVFNGPWGSFRHSNFKYAID